MTIKQIVKSLLPPILLEALRKAGGSNDLQPRDRYIRGARIPWSEGYGAYKFEWISGRLNDEKCLEQFSLGQSLEDGYGRGLDERCVEYPWLFSRLEQAGGTLLDAGSVLNHQCLVEHPLIRSKNVHILTLEPEADCFWKKKISYLYHDLRDLPIRDDFYDTVVCLSTLEHVGCDNTAFSGKQIYQENRPDDFEKVMKEFRRVLKPGSHLYLTVPYGAYMHHGIFQQFDRELLSRAEKAFGAAPTISETFYRYLPGGWTLARDSDCAESRYVEWLAQAYREKKMPDPIPVEPDGAAAARAVACVRLQKTPQGQLGT